MALVESPTIALFGIVATLAVFGGGYWDATRVEMSRPLLWATIAAVPVAIGVGLYLFVPNVPMTGVILTANTGLVLYGFEREVTTSDEEPAEPGTLPDR